MHFLLLKITKRFLWKRKIAHLNMCWKNRRFFPRIYFLCTIVKLHEKGFHHTSLSSNEITSTLYSIKAVLLTDKFSVQTK
jgi:hypothetical protein